MKKILSKMIIKYLDGFSANEVEQQLEVPTEAKMGDYSLPCFALSKKLKNHLL